MMRFSLIIILSIFFCSCDRVSDSAKEKIDAGAVTVGKTATDIVNSIDKGISSGSAITFAVSEDLAAAGLSTGKYYLRENDKGHDNIISIYIITDKDFNKNLRLKLFDKKGVEMGRVSRQVKQGAGMAGYHDFVFDERISFEDKSKITIE